MTSRTLVVCSVAIGLAGAASPALAQRQSGPYAGALGAPASENRVQGLDLGASIFGAWDENIFPDSAPVEQFDQRLVQSGASAGGAATLSYEGRGDRARFGLNGGIAAQRYSSNPDLVTAYNAGASLSANLTSRVVFNAGAGVGYSPFYQFSPFGGSTFVNSGGPLLGNAGGLNSSFTYAAGAERNLWVDGSASVTANFTERTSAYASATARDWRTLDHSEISLRGYGADGGIRHNLTRALALHVGYGRYENDYALADIAPYSTETIDAGVDYGDTLKFARRTALRFSSSTAAIRYANETHYRLNGSAALTRGFKRTWSAQVAYDRNTEYRIGFRAPLLNDSVRAGIGGLISRRMQWSGNGDYTYGAIGFTDDKFTVVDALTRLDFALNRRFALYGQYAFYHYKVPQDSAAFELTPHFSRQVATVGLTLRVPLINTVRPPREPRQP